MFIQVQKQLDTFQAQKDNQMANMEQKMQRLRC